MVKTLPYYLNWKPIVCRQNFLFRGNLLCCLAKLATNNVAVDSGQLVSYRNCAVLYLIAILVKLHARACNQLCWSYPGNQKRFTSFLEYHPVHAHLLVRNLLSSYKHFRGEQSAVFSHLQKNKFVQILEVSQLPIKIHARHHPRFKGIPKLQRPVCLMSFFSKTIIRTDILK